MSPAATATPIQATLAARYTSAPYNSSHARSVLGRAVALNPPVRRAKTSPTSAACQVRRNFYDPLDVPPRIPEDSRTRLQRGESCCG